MTHASLLAATLLSLASAPAVARPPPPRSAPATSAAQDAGTSAGDEEEWAEASLTYGECEAVRREGDEAPRSARGWLSPELCGRVTGWAGIGTLTNGYAFGFSRDARHFVSCGPQPACEVLDLSTGHTTERVAPDWRKSEGPGAIPVERTPSVAQLFQREGVTGAKEPFPYAKDLLVSWVLEQDGRALHVTFVDRASGVEREVLRFPKRGPLSEQPIVPERAWLSPGGGVLAVRVATTQGGSGIEVGLVNVHAEAAALYRAVAEQRPDRRKDALTKADAAEARSRSVARVLP